MQKRYPLFALACVLLLACQQQSTTSPTNLPYPETATVDTVDTYFGHEVADPYRWLEDDQSAETADWVKAQNGVTQDYLTQLPFREKIAERLEALENYEKVSAPYKEGDYWYYSQNSGLQNQSIMYRKKDLEGEGTLFFDPNTLSEDGTVSLGGRSFSKDGKYFAYALSYSGSDWREIRVMNTETMEVLPDKINWAKFTGISWLDDGFFYQSFPEPKEGGELSGQNQYGKIYYHRLGQDQSADELIFENPENPEERFGAGVSEDGRFLIVSAAEKTYGNMLYAKDLSQPGADFVQLIDNKARSHQIVASKGNTIYIRTDLDAPNGRLVKTTLDKPTPEHWQDVIPQTEQVLQVSQAGEYLMASYLMDAKTAVKQYDFAGEMVREVELPGIGTARGFGAKAEDKDLFYTFSSFTVPNAIYRYDLASGESTLFRQAKTAFNPDDFITEQVFYKSKDGTRVPMFIVYKKGFEKNGQSPAWMYAYGGFNISLTPSFRASRIAWLEQGGVFAQPNLRGGGEYGKAWHKAGTQMQKQNVFDDFIAAGEYLIKEGYTSQEYLALEGGSNGGLLIGATINQRPDLARVAFPRVGVMDMLRYQYFTIGRAWSYDYGTSEDSEEMFQYLKGYSPLHNIDPEATYPSTMVMTADHDDRVVPAHSFKYGATLQAKAGHGPNPLLLRIESKAGHGAGTPTSKRIAQTADQYAFAWHEMGLQPRYDEGAPLSQPVMD
ncbi:MAG: prolyl oligopeptidase family serine peptidase [Bacteroidota bacterium]